MDAKESEVKNTIEKPKEESKEELYETIACHLYGLMKQYQKAKQQCFPSAMVLKEKENETVDICLKFTRGLMDLIEEQIQKRRKEEDEENPMNLIIK